jgi:hypothetical protein
VEEGKYKDGFAWADITGSLVYGEHRLSLSKPAREGWLVGGGYPPCEFRIDLITPPGHQAEFQVIVKDQTATSLSSQPLEQIVQEWKDLQGALPP